MITGINHITFAVSDLEKSINFYTELKNRLKNAGFETFKDNTSEGYSFYFLDPDNHKLELHYNTLEHRLNWARENDWSSFIIE